MALMICISHLKSYYDNLATLTSWNRFNRLYTTPIVIKRYHGDTMNIVVARLNAKALTIQTNKMRSTHENLHEEKPKHGTSWVIFLKANGFEPELCSAVPGSLKTTTSCSTICPRGTHSTHSNSSRFQSGFFMSNRTKHHYWCWRVVLPHVVSNLFLGK